MKTLTEITNIIAKQMGEVAKTAARDYDIIVCPERIFMDDYLPEEERYIATLGEMQSLDVDSPQDLPYKNTIFVVIKMGSGQANMGVANYSCTLQVLSEADDFTAARQLLDSFIAEYNFEYIDGIVQSYFTPDMGGSQESVYTGFRALMSCRGNVRVPESGLVFVTDVLVSFDGKTYFNLPYLNVMYNHSCQPDPQAFAGTKGRTMALNRQSTQTITFDTYLWNKGVYKANGGATASQTPDSMLDLFSIKVVKAHSDMNKKFKLMVRTPIERFGVNADGVDESGSNLCVLSSGIKVLADKYKEVSSTNEMNEADTLYLLSNLGSKNYYYVDSSFIRYSLAATPAQNRECIFDDWFILTNAAYNQAWGDVSSWSITFTSALKEEK